MNASRPEAEIEYSTAVGAGSGALRGFWAALILAAAGVLAWLVAEALPLLRVETIAAHPMLLRTVRTGPHDGWALVPLALLAAMFVWIAWSSRRRVAFAGVGVLGLAGLAIALLIDRPDIHASGAVQVAGVLQPAQIRAGVGLYVETLGAACLIVAAGAGLLV